MCCDRRNWDKFVCPKCDKAFGLHFDEKQQLRKEPLQQAAPGSNDAVLLAIRAVLATEHPGLFAKDEEALKAPPVKQDLPADVWAPFEASRKAVAAERQKVQKAEVKQVELAKKLKAAQQAFDDAQKANMEHDVELVSVRDGFRKLLVDHEKIFPIALTFSAG